MIGRNEIDRRRKAITKRSVTAEGARALQIKQAYWIERFLDSQKHAKVLTPGRKAELAAEAKHRRALADNVSYLEGVVRVNQTKNALDLLEIALAEKYANPYLVPCVDREDAL